jgi:signal transduction histidine kinase
VVAETERLSRLVNQVLDLAKIESGHAEWHNTDVDLCALARQAAQSLDQALREQGTVLELDVPDALPPLRADADRLMQVLLNLLGNAAKFVPQPGGRIALRVCGTPVGVVVQVRDNGPGVPPEQAALVFERFRQGGSSERRPSGTGLGLPISRQIVEHFGGRMALVHDGGQGACFEFHLPWGGAGPAPAATTSPPTAGGQGDTDEDHHPHRR